MKIMNALELQKMIFIYNALKTGWSVKMLTEEKFEFKYKYADNPLGVIGKGHYFNSVSNFYQQSNRYKCGSVFCKAPLQIWNDKELLKKMNWHFWRDGVMLHYNLDDQAFRAAFRLGTYVATQFKPIVAKLIYQKTNASGNGH